MKGIPTTFNGRRYRSLLEARWAAFFTSLKWDFHYESLELPGWIPDFYIEAPNPILVEVKPHIAFVEFTDAIEKALKAIANYGYAFDILFVGLYPAEYKGFDGAGLIPDDFSAARLGWGNDPNWNGETGTHPYVVTQRHWTDLTEPNEAGIRDFSEVVFARVAPKLGYVNEYGEWRDRITDQNNGDSIEVVRWSEIKRLWDSACNLVQYKGDLNPSFSRATASKQARNVL